MLSLEPNFRFRIYLNFLNRILVAFRAKPTYLLYLLKDLILSFYLCYNKNEQDMFKIRMNGLIHTLVVND